jgi:hypothetical protein
VSDDGEPSTGLAFSRMIRPESVADIVSAKVARTETLLIYGGSGLLESSGRCKERQLLSYYCVRAKNATRPKAVVHGST